MRTECPPAKPAPSSGPRAAEWATRLSALDDAVTDLAVLLPFARLTECLDGRLASVDDRAATWLGSERDALVGRRQLQDFLTSASRRSWDCRGWSAPSRRGGAGLAVAWQSLRGSEHRATVVYRALPATRGALVHSGPARTAFLFADGWARLQGHAGPWLALADTTGQAQCLLDAQGRLHALDAAFTQLTGREVAESLGCRFDQLALIAVADLAAWGEQLLLALDGGTGSIQMPLRRRDGQVVQVAVLLQGWRSAAGGTRWVACRMVAVPSVAAAADTPGAIEVDTLTGLPNRASLRPRLQAALAEAHDRGQMAALILLDLDHFKQLNDTQGHEAGDALLVEVAQRLRGLLRPHDTVARLGGDEFVLLLTELADDHEAAADAAQRIARKALDAVALPFSHEGGEFLATASLGLCMCSGAETVSALLQQADLAMYAAKRAGRGRVAVFDRAMQQAATAEVVLDQELSKALRRGQLHLNYQPQVNHGGAVHGAEVLLRWRHPVRGMVSPAEFIPAAERSDAILAIGDWVLVQACQQLQQWAADARTQHLMLSVNVSARQLAQPEFVSQVVQTLEAHGLGPGRLRLELTESSVHDVEDTSHKMAALSAAGVSFSMDDFGTGYSSLSSLTRLPLAELKIDRSFVAHMTERPSDAIVVQTIVSMARSLGLVVVAEGVETASQRDALIQAGCTLFQGYWFARPMPIDDFDAWLRERPGCQRQGD
jgi:diguanylate cyclase (GGDEF)-like protein